ncbi:MAG: hypothetical protein JXR96_00365, partial [Deltaproteobacteria bacterium]|nr:hypothetical protein [Deltaproteobacteria bacterium]
EVCSGGSCGLSCAGGTTLCAGRCVDTDLDPDNCGGCDRLCSYDHGVAACIDRSCLLAACSGGWDDCDGLDTNGCEADLSSDDAHCGQCNLACAWTEECVTSSCQLCIIGRTGLSFDGVDDTLFVGDDDALDITAAISFEAWVYSTAPGTDAPILAKENSGGRQQYWFGVFFGHFGLLLGNGSGWGLNQRGSGTVVANTWTHLASVWDGTHWYNYQDGVLVGTGAYTGTLPTSDQPLTIAINSGYDNTRYGGALSDIRLWNVARTEQQIRDNMCELSDRTGLLARWLMDEGSGQTAADDSGNGFDGRLGEDPAEDDRDPTWVLLPAP